ncbi:MAG: hypothetical protein H8M99_01980 [Gloeobacteraceae cyanobacterium ES-bin-144]|nr:hypothetical protein [Verrucomicrobiales bacterium]
MVFYSEETGLPFSRCNDCGGTLTDQEDGYFIQKVLNAGETILEMAICNGCHDRLQQSYSKKSREQIWNFYLDHADLPERRKKFHALPPMPDFWMNNCLTCKTLRGRSQEYGIAARCVGEYLILDETPMMVCSDCMGKMIEVMSEESLETYDCWMERVIPPAADFSINKPRRRVFF